MGVSAATIASYVAFGAFLPWREEEEAQRLARVAGIGPGAAVVEIGAGTGRFTAAMARAVGPNGRVFATEIDQNRLRDVRERIAADGLDNVTVIEATTDATNLPDACCDVVYLRNVYHHIREPEAFAASLARAVKPGGRLVVIDFEPGALWLHGGKPDDASRRLGHGVSRADAVAELATAGFQFARTGRAGFARCGWSCWKRRLR